MAMLLAMFQKMRLTREYNRETLNLTRFSHKVDRIAKSIKNVQKMYAAKIKTLEQQAKLGTSIFKYGMNSTYNAANMLAGIMSKGSSKSIWDAMQNNTLKYDNEKQAYSISGKPISKEAMDAYNNEYQKAQMQVSYNQQQVAMQCQAQEQYVQAQLEAAKEQIEMEQEMALEPLEYEQTMMELDKEASEERCQRLKAEIESYDQLLKEETKNAAPKFGLG